MSTPADQIGPCTITREIGRGGMFAGSNEPLKPLTLVIHQPQLKLGESLVQLIDFVEVCR